MIKTNNFLDACFSYGIRLFCIIINILGMKELFDGEIEMSIVYFIYMFFVCAIFLIYDAVKNVNCYNMFGDGYDEEPAIKPEHSFDLDK